MATTYKVTHNLQVDTSFPVIDNSTYTPGVSVYFKLGDTIQSQPSHPTGGTLGISLQDGNEANPDPSNLGGTFTHNDDYTYELLWSGTFAEGGSASSDFLTKWYHFNRTGTLAFTSQIVYRRVACSLGLSTTSLTSSGGNITVTASSIQGLQAPSGSFGHRLFLYVKDSSGSVVSSNVSFSTQFGGNSHIGLIATNQTTNTLTVGSSLSSGTYTVHIGHFGYIGHSENSFTGSSHSIASVSFSKDVAADTTPNQFSLGSDVTGLSLNEQYDAASFNVAGITSAANVSVSGSGSPQFSIAGGSFVTSGTVTNGQAVIFRMQASSSYATAQSATLNIGGVTDSLQLTTIADPGSGSGAASGTATYGVEVKNASGNTTMSAGFKVASIIATGTGTSTTSGTILPASGTFEGFTSTNQGKVDIFVYAENQQAAPFIGIAMTVTRGSSSNGIGEGKVKVNHNYQGANIPITFYVMRTE